MKNWRYFLDHPVARLADEIIPMASISEKNVRLIAELCHRVNDTYNIVIHATLDSSFVWLIHIQASLLTRRCSYAEVIRSNRFSFRNVA